MPAIASYPISPCCVSMHTQSKPAAAITSAESVLGIEHQPPIMGRRRSHSSRSRNA